uniref:Glyco_trans_4-like_N domain-containing protein n=1 Tax=Globodera pallida TaxID=36090 RepID=A0A183C9Y0_GLOPA
MQRISITLNAIIILLHFNFVGTTTILRRSLRIAQVAPMFENIPPMRSVTAGGASRNVQHLTEELVRRGHDVTLTLDD